MAIQATLPAPNSLPMPELPEVHTVQLYFNGTSLHQKIADVRVHDDHIIRNISGEAFRTHLLGRTFTGSYRRGKYFFPTLDNGHHLQLHLGMSGDLKFFHEPEEEPKHSRFRFDFEAGGHLAFDCPRKLARVLYLENLAGYLDSIGLGEDALRIGEDAFLAKMEGRKGAVKAFLMNQNLIAGIGNLYADEICYQAGVHPASVTGNIDQPTRRLIFRKMREILTYAVNRQAHYRDYPADWLWQWRKEGHPSPDGGGRVAKTVIGGRTTYFLASRQKRF